MTLFWFRRDLRLEDNAGLYHALKEGRNVLPLFIFDINILKNLQKEDLRVSAIYQIVNRLKEKLNQLGSDLIILHGDPMQIFSELLIQYQVKSVYTNHDYEPIANKRDQQVKNLCEKSNVKFHTFKDQSLFEKNEILTEAGKPYTVYTPYKNKWLSSLSGFYLQPYQNEKYKNNYYKFKIPSISISLQQIGFSEAKNLSLPNDIISIAVLKNYATNRDYPYLENATSKLGFHLRFGTISPRKAVRIAKEYSDVWLSELIWRDFFMQILWHFPYVQKQSFRKNFDQLSWRDSEKDFQAWCNGQTGYPLVDAGMRELNATGHMHNRVRMVVASFLTKHLLIHWSKGERYFAHKLLDYDMAANNGNWQWAAGTGCDAAPYFRIFNPTAQQIRFDPDFVYIKKWVPEYRSGSYVNPIVEHVFARERALSEYKKLKK